MFMAMLAAPELLLAQELTVQDAPVFSHIKSAPAKSVSSPDPQPPSLCPLQRFCQLAEIYLTPCDDMLLSVLKTYAVGTHAQGG